MATRRRRGGDPPRKGYLAPQGMSFSEYVSSRPPLRDPIEEHQEMMLRHRGGATPEDIRSAEGMASRALEGGLFASQFAPVTGDLWDLWDVAAGTATGNWSQAGIGAAGLLVPFVGGRALKAGGEAVRGLIPSRVPTKWDEGISSTLLDNLEEGGATINPKTGKLMPIGEDAPEMYAFSPFKDRERVVTRAELTPELIDEYVKENAEELGKKGRHLGLWAPKGEDKVYLDVSELGSDLGKVAKRAAKAKQEAIFDMKGVTSIPTGEAPALARTRKLASVPAEELPAWEKAFARRDAGLATPEARARSIAEMEMGMTPEELMEFRGGNRKLQEDTLEAYLMAPSPEDFAQAILLGREGRGWYKNAAAAIHFTFGDDAHRFAALLAAMSPNKQVEPSLHYALDTWERWTRAGRPSEITKDMIASPLPADFENSVKALTASQDELLKLDPKFLSGPKVGPFYSSLMGELENIVHDTHQATGYGTTPARIGKKSRGLASSSMVRNAGRYLEEKGVGAMPGGNLQETSWGTIKGVKEAAGKYSPGSRTTTSVMQEYLENPDAVFSAGRTLPDRIADNAAMSDLMRNPEAVRRLEALGLRSPPEMPKQAFEGRVPEINPEGLLDITRRIDAARRGDPFYSVAGGLFGAGALTKYQKEQRERKRRAGGLLEI